MRDIVGVGFTYEEASESGVSDSSARAASSELERLLRAD